MTDNRAAAEFWGHARRAAGAFVAAPASAAPLAVWRIGVAAVLLVQAFGVAGRLDDLYGPQGLAPWTAVEDRALTGSPRLSWLAGALAPFDVGPAGALRGAFLAYVGGLACLLIGWHTRL